MSARKGKGPKRPTRYTPPPKIKPLPPGKPLALPATSLPAGKFRDIPGQAAMDLWPASADDSPDDAA